MATGTSRDFAVSGRPRTWRKINAMKTALKM